MKVIELRLGNYVLYGKHIITVYNIHRDIINYAHAQGADDGDLIESLTGIPLTEEWLLKLGFEKPFNVVLNEYYPDYSFNHFHVDLKIEDNMSVCYIYCIKGSFRFVNYHVHQLQNLYFTLTGEELIIKE